MTPLYATSLRTFLLTITGVMVVRSLLAVSVSAAGDESLRLGNTFSTAGNSRANGLKVSIRYPAGWIARTAKSGGKATVVQVFTPEHSLTSEMCALVVNPIPLPPSLTLSDISEDDIAEEFTDEALRKRVPPGAQFQSSVPQKIAGCLGARFEYTRRVSVGGNTITIYTSHYLFYLEGNIVGLECTLAGAPTESTEQSRTRFEKAKGVYQSMVESISLGMAR